MNESLKIIKSYVNSQCIVSSAIKNKTCLVSAAPHQVENDTVNALIAMLMTISLQQAFHR